MKQNYNRILKFERFLSESKQSIEEYHIDQRFPWAEEIGNLIDQVEEKAKGIEEEFDYDRHDSKGFEFNIKARNWPDSEKIIKLYGISEEAFYDYWQSFLDENLEMFADDIIENTKFLEGWGVYGRSGGWLSFTYKDYDFTEYSPAIGDILSDLNYQTENLTDEEVEEWKQFKETANAGFSILKRLNAFKQFEEIHEAERIANYTKENLESFLKKLDDLKNELLGIQERIKKFWENSVNDFNEWIKYEIEESGDA